MSQSLEGLVPFGFVTRAHGIKGELRVYSQLADLNSFAALDQVFIEIQKSTPRPFSVEVFRIQTKDQVLFRLKGIDNRNEAELLAGAAVLIDQKWIPIPEPGQYSYRDLVGFDLHDTQLGFLENIKGILELPAQDAFQIYIDGYEVLIPIVEDWIELVDLEAQNITMRLPNGMVDVYVEGYSKRDRSAPSEQAAE